MKSAAVLLIVLLAGAAHAQLVFDLVPLRDDTAPRARQLYEAGAADYASGRYDLAIAVFRQAYDLLPRPLFLFDIAQSYRQLHDCTHARSYYRYYLRVAPAADNRAQAERFAAEQDACAPPEPAVARPRDPDPEPVSIAAPVVAAPRDRGLEIAGIVTAAAGAALAGGGAYYSIDARRIEQGCGARCWGPDRGAAEGERRNADLAFAVGGAAVVTGTLMILFGTTENRVEVTPAHGGASVSAKLRF